MKTSAKVVSGKSYFAEQGSTEFKWTIEEFGSFLDFGQTVKSPSFTIDATDASSKVASFHLEMEVPRKTPYSQCPIFLIQETAGEFLTKIALQSSSPKSTVYGNFYVKLDISVVQMSFDDRKKVLSAYLPSYIPYIPKDVTIDLKVAICKPTEYTF